MSSASAVKTATADYVEQQLESDQGAQDVGVQLALYFQRVAPTASNEYGILADPNLLEVAPWIPEPSATGLREADLNVLAKLGEQGLEWRLEAEAFARREVCGEDDLLDFLFGHSVDIQVTRQPST